MAPSLFGLFVCVYAMQLVSCTRLKVIKLRFDGRFGSLYVGKLLGYPNQGGHWIIGVNGMIILKWVLNKYGRTL
jgi:hypothetical protein